MRVYCGTGSSSRFNTEYVINHRTSDRGYLNRIAKAKVERKSARRCAKQEIENNL